MSAHMHLDDVEPIRVGELTWLPLRRALGATGFGIGAWTAAEAGDELIEHHDETSTGAGAQEELYLVLGGRATFTVGDQEVDAPAGTLVLVDVGTPRSAVAAEPHTTVLVVGGRPGAALPAAPFEHYYTAQPAYDAGDYDRAVAIASEGLGTGPTTRSSTTSSPASTPGPGAWTTRAGRSTSPSRATSARGSGRLRTTTWRRCAIRSSALRLRRFVALTASPRGSSPGAARPRAVVLWRG